MDRTSLEQLLGQGLSFAEIGQRFGRREATVGYWVKKYGLQAVNRDKHMARGGIARRDLKPLVEQGISIAKIAEAVKCSKGNRAVLARAKWTENPVAAVGRRGIDACDETGRRGDVMRECRKHGIAEFWLEGRGYYRCKRPRWERVSQRRRKVKLLVAEAGRRCVLCGYDRCIGALHFHHVDEHQAIPSEQARRDSLADGRASRDGQVCAAMCELSRGVRVGPGDLASHGRYSKQCGLESWRRSGAARLAERSTVNREVVGSSPTPGVIARNGSGRYRARRRRLSVSVALIESRSLAGRSARGVTLRGTEQLLAERLQGNRQDDRLVGIFANHPLIFVAPPWFLCCSQSEESPRRNFRGRLGFRPGRRRNTLPYEQTKSFRRLFAVPVQGRPDGHSLVIKERKGLILDGGCRIAASPLAVACELCPDRRPSSTRKTTMDEYDITHSEAIEKETRHRRLSDSRAAPRGRARLADRRKASLLKCLGWHCKSVCGANIRLPGPVGSGGARPLRAPGCAFHRPCLVVPGPAL
jgi:hypothetical protein